MNDVNELHVFLWELELPILFISIFLSAYFANRWYKTIYKTLYKHDKTQVLFCLNIIPVVSIIIIFVIVITLAAPSVVESGFYILFYTILGMVFVFLQARLMRLFWDLSWWYDVLNLNNKAAVLPVFCGMVGTAILYAAMNIGDGDGWWCVLVPFIMCWGLWFLLAMLLLSFGQLAEKITVERNINAGLRFSFYLIVLALLISWINMGDWTSFGVTVEEFMASWPVIILAFIILVIERLWGRAVETRSN